jgi:hypothetical protein
MLTLEVLNKPLKRFLTDQLKVSFVSAAVVNVVLTLKVLLGIKRFVRKSLLHREKFSILKLIE